MPAIVTKTTLRTRDSTATSRDWASCSGMGAAIIVTTPVLYHIMGCIARLARMIITVGISGAAHKLSRDRSFRTYSDICSVFPVISMYKVYMFLFRDFDSLKQTKYNLHNASTLTFPQLPIASMGGPVVKCNYLRCNDSSARDRIYM